MWEFTVHEFVSPHRWTWAQISASGRIIQRSRQAFPNWASVFTDATNHGFDYASDGFHLLRLAQEEVQQPSQTASAMG